MTSWQGHIQGGILGGQTPLNFLFHTKKFQNPFLEKFLDTPLLLGILVSAKSSK